VELIKVVLGFAVPLALSGQVNLSGVWRWDRLAKDASSNATSQMWKKIDQDGARITVRTKTLSAGGAESQVFVLFAGTSTNANRMHGAPMTSSVRWEGATLQVDSVARFGDGDLHMYDTYRVSADGKQLTFRERHQFGSEAEGIDETIFLRQPDSAWPADEPPKLAEQVYKNIQILKGLPAPQLQSTMAAFARSLGVSCTYCHVPDAFEKDDKDAKLTARKMIRMVNTIGDFFNDASAVSCWTCHRGKTKPETEPQ
jgi:hypothetical protein